MITNALLYLAVLSETTPAEPDTGTIPNPGAGVAPPGSDGVLTLLQWVAWIAFAVCVAGVISTGAQMGWEHRRGGGGGEHGSRLAWTLGGAIVIGSAASLVTAMT